MFSTLLHEGKEYQFKTGHDDALGCYKLGDTINWVLDDFWPGSHVDGVHDAIDVHDGPSVWVVVKDSKIVAVEPWEAGAGEASIQLIHKYGITAPPRSLWPKSAWKKKAKREAEAERKWRQWKAVHGDDPAGYYIYCKLKEPSFFDQILPARKL